MRILVCAFASKPSHRSPVEARLLKADCLFQIMLAHEPHNDVLLSCAASLLQKRISIMKYCSYCALTLGAFATAMECTGK